MDLKSKWLGSFKMQWLVQGHLTQESAVNIVERACQAIGYKPEHDNMPNEYKRMVKLEPNTVFNFSEFSQNQEDSEVVN